jgi:hypothetical protein
MKVSYDNRKKGFATTILRGSVGTDNSAMLVTTYKLKNYNFDLQMDLTTVISGEKHVSNLEYEHKGKLNDFTCIGSLKTSYNNMDKRMKINFKGTDVIDDFDGSFEFKDGRYHFGFLKFKVTIKISQVAIVFNFGFNHFKSFDSAGKHQGAINI